MRSEINVTIELTRPFFGRFQRHLRAARDKLCIGDLDEFAARKAASQIRASLMFSLYHRRKRLCHPLYLPTDSNVDWSRREMLRFGGLGALGLTLPNLLSARETAPQGIPPTDKTFGRAKNIIFLYLAGGPPQHETFDPKPDAPAEVRGPFNPVSTNVPGIQFCELLPRTAGIADKLAVVRSMATDDNTHSSSSYWVLTGYKYTGPNARTIQQTDWPYWGSVVKRFKPSDVLPPLSTVWVPDIMRLNENVTPAGQTGGFMGSEWDPDRFVGDPSAADYQVEGLRMADMTADELAKRKKLLNRLEESFDGKRRGNAAQLYGGFQEQAFDLLTSGKAQEAFAVHKEPERVRERYGKNRWGQCVLLARRLVEAGVRLVHVQWPREPGDNAVDNPLWDTHAQNADRVEDVLCPTFDVGFSALVEDLDERGLLDETLVVAIGEFGRTPKINAKGGRDHWGSVFSFAMAGAGISGGQVFGASDREGGRPKEDRVEPGDLTATLYHLAGIDYRSTFQDREGRGHRLTEGAPIFKLLGTEPATEQRATPTADIGRVPPFDPTVTLYHRVFGAEHPILPSSAPSRPKGWRASPLATADNVPPFGVQEVDTQARIGLLRSTDAAAPVATGAEAFLAQEVRSPFAGTYRLKVKLRAGGDSAESFTELFGAHFTCEIQFFEYTNAGKPATHRKVLGAEQVKPIFEPAQEADVFQLEKSFVNPKPGSNFSFGLGLGVAIVVRRTSKGELAVNGEEFSGAYVVVEEVEVEFEGKERNAKVKV